MAKKKSGKASAVTGRKSGTGKFKRSTGKMAAVSKRSAPVSSGHELVPVICSACFEDFAFDTGVRTDALVCPVCEHSAARPDDATLHRISTLRKEERTSFMITLMLTLIATGSFGAWGAMVGDPANAAKSELFWGPLGVAGLCVLALFVFTFKYEGNRWETYF